MWVKREEFKNIKETPFSDILKFVFDSIFFTTMKYAIYRKLSFVHTIFAAHNLQEVGEKYKMADPIKAKDQNG